MYTTELTHNFYSAIVKNSSDLISTLDSEGFYTYVSDSIRSILGYEQEEILGRSAYEFIHQDDLEAVVQALAQISEQKQLLLAPFRFKHKDDSWRWLECTVTNMLEDPTVNGFVTNSREITDKILADIKQQKSKAYYSALFFNHPDLVFTLNTEGRVDNANDGVFALTGYRKEDVWDSYFSSFIKPACLEEAQQAFRKALSGEAFTFETTILNANGQEIILYVTLVPVILYNQVKGVQCIAKDVTEIKQANQRLKAHASQLNNILESITEPFIALDRQWQYSYANLSGCNFLKATQAELLGTNIWEKYPGVIGTAFYTHCHEVAATGVPAEFDEYVPLFRATLNFRIYPFETGIAVQFKDTTAIKAAQEELRKLSLVASKTNNAVFITNNQHEIEWVNEAFTTQTGYTLQEVLGKQPTAVLHGPDTNVQDAVRIASRIASGENITQEMLCYTKSGESFWVTVDLTPTFDEDQQLSKIIVIQTDITERKLARLKLEQLTDDLVKQNRDLQQFTYIVSHNLRAPVANVVGLTKLLQIAKPEAPHFKEALLNLDKSALRLDAVIKDLNQILSLKTGADDRNSEQLKLREIIEEVVSSLHTTIKQHQASITIAVGENHLLAANRAYVYSIFHNLLLNALKYRSQERAPKIHVESGRQDGALYVRVRDNGLGMNMDKVRPLIFTLYSRFHTHIEGKGFGLYLVKSQVEALGGTIDVESEVGKGTEFILQFGKSVHVQKNICN